ncbi:hypothetical protein PanWU01x14_089200 [Parasponia andersonii]|uniref:Uncharacterized protein n=1 Tax=Parasponia andersonii TaxID=3476 RepID=A0A2P5D7A9_PARAD|nr:hypothetical protein PanWU01x14_089200 [Parasponia andersonii]
MPHNNGEPNLHTAIDDSQFESHTLTIGIKPSGCHGLFFGQDKSKPYIIVVKISQSCLFDAMHNTLPVALRRHNRFTSSASTSGNLLAINLTTGCCAATYLRLGYIVLAELHELCFFKRVVIKFA